MNTASGKQALTHVSTRSPILGVPFDPGAVEGAPDESSVDLKGYLRTL